MRMNKLMSFLNKILESLRVTFRMVVHFINRYFKLIIIVFIIVYLAIFYQSTLNQRYQYHETVDDGHHHIVIFDTKKGVMYIIQGSEDDPFGWVEVSPFSERRENGAY
jgi:hypothetical protein